MADWRKSKNTPAPTAPSAPEPASRSKKDATSTEAAAGRSGGKVSWKGKPTSNQTQAFWVAGGGKRSAWRGMALFVSGLGIIGLGALFSIQILRGDQPTPCVVITGLSFDSPWMPNAWAKEDADRLATWFNAAENEQSLQCVTHQEGKNGPWDSILEQQLGLVKPGGPGGSLIFWKYSSLVIYLSAHGVVQNGRPCLVFSNDTVADFADVLRVIDQHKQQKNARLLVVIDSGRQLPDARLTNLDNKFFTAAKQVVEAQTRKHLAVLFSAGDDQVAWGAPELSGTIFGTFLAEAFLGHADSSRNNRLTVKEVGDYIASRVENYALRTRAAPQQPKLVWSQGKEHDFELSYCDADTVKSIEPAPEVDATRLSALKSAWDEFEPWRDKALRIDPWRVAQVRDELSYADQLVWAGSAYAKQASENIELARRHMQSTLERQFQLTGSSRFRGSPPEPIFNLPAPVAVVQASQQVPANKAPGESSVGGDQTAEKKPSAPAPAADSAPSAPEGNAKPTFADLARKWLEQPNSADGKELEPPQAKDFQEYIAFAWWWLEQSEPQHWSRTRLANLEKLRPQASLAPQSLRLEDAVILAAFEDASSIATIWDSGDPQVNEQWPKFLTLLDDVQQRIVTPMERDTRVVSSVRTAVESLYGRLRLARDQLHARRTPESMADETIAKLAKELQADQDQWRTLDEYADELPLLINWPLATSMVADIQASMDLCAAISSDAAQSWPSLREAHERMRRQYSQQVHSLAAEREASSPESFQRIQMHLLHRPVQAGERSQLHEKLKSYHRVLTASNRAELSSPGSEVKDSFEPLRITELLLKSFAALTRQELASDPGLGLEKSWQDFIASIPAAKGWWEGEANRDADQLSSNAKKVRLCANLAPRAAVSSSVQLPPLFDAARLEEERAWHDYLLWRAHDALEDFWRTPQDSIGSEQPYFALCASAALRAADDLEHCPKASRDAVREQLTQALDLSGRWLSILDQTQPRTNSDTKSFAVDWQSKSYPSGMARVALRSRRLGDEETKLKEAVAVGSGTKSNHIEAQVLGAESGRMLVDFRGHRASAQFAFTKAQSRWTLAQNFRVDPKTTVTVGSAPLPVEIVFALDCSGSFEKEDFNTAKDALRRALKELEGRPLLSIALVVFGHSRNFPDTTFPEKNEAWATEFPGKSGERFDSDVVVLENLAPATPELSERINKYLDKLEPFGATPLYMAAQESKKLLDASFQANPSKDVLRRVIIITDGENNVTATANGKPVPATPQYSKYRPRPQFDRTEKDVDATFSQLAKASLDVIHIGAAQNPAMQMLAQKFNGKFRNANFDALANDLSDTLNPLRFTVNPLTGRTSDKLERFRAEWPLPGLPQDGTSEDFRIVVTAEGNEVASKQVRIFAGDHLAVEYAPAQRTFSFPFDRPPRLPLKFGDGLQAWRIESRSNSRDVRFVLDQQDATQQTLRPAIVFLEVSAEPLGQGASGAQSAAKLAFWTSDLVWEWWKLRPACLATIDRGPDTALPARLWVRSALPEKEGEIPLQNVRSKSTGEPLDIGGVKVMVEGSVVSSGYELEVTTIPAKSARLIVVAPRADAIEHQFFADGQVTHRYIYSEKPSGSVAFFKAPSYEAGAADPEWRSTGWVETER